MKYEVVLNWFLEYFYSPSLWGETWIPPTHATWLNNQASLQRLWQWAHLSFSALFRLASIFYFFLGTKNTLNSNVYKPDPKYILWNVSMSEWWKLMCFFPIFWIVMLHHQDFNIIWPKLIQICILHTFSSCGECFWTLYMHEGVKCCGEMVKWHDGHEQTKWPGFIFFFHTNSHSQLV